MWNVPVSKGKQRLSMEKLQRTPSTVPVAPFAKPSVRSEPSNGGELTYEEGCGIGNKWRPLLADLAASWLCH
jgi:hypothetical protein